MLSHVYTYRTQSAKQLPRSIFLQRQEPSSRSRCSIGFNQLLAHWQHISNPNFEPSLIGCRHMEDGCSKRFDIGTLDISQEHYRPSEMSQEVEWHGDIAPRAPIPFTPSTMMPEHHGHAHTAFNSHNHHSNMTTTSNGQTSVWSR